MATDLTIAQYGYKTNKASGLLNDIFMYTVNMAAKTLVSVAQTSKTEDTEKWKTTDHLRFMIMLMTWVTVWVLRVLMDHFPLSSSLPFNPLGGSLSALGSFDSILSSVSSSSALALPSSASSSLDLVLYEEVDAPSIKALGRSLTHVSVPLPS